MNQGRLFFIFFKSGLVAFGGGRSMMAILEKELVKNHKVVSQEEFSHSVLTSQLSFGSSIISLAISLGNKVSGFSGSLICLLGALLPSMIILLIIGAFYDQFSNSSIVANAFKGAFPAIVSIIAAVGVKFIFQNGFKVLPAVFALVAFVAMAILDVNPFGLIVLGAVIGVLILSERNSLAKKSVVIDKP